MKERPIIFNAEMVRAILEGRKTQTRRPVKPQPQMVTNNSIEPWNGNPESLQKKLEKENKGCPFGKPGGRLWVRETYWNKVEGFCDYSGEWGSYYLDDFRYGIDNPGEDYIKRPSIHMPRKASRILLEITNIRVERVQEVSEQDCISEGIKYNPDGSVIGYPFGVPFFYSDGKHNYTTAQEAYQALWQSIYGKDSWERNDWIWVVEFKRVEVSKC